MPSYTVDIYSFVAGVILGLIIFMALIGVIRSAFVSGDDRRRLDRDDR